MTDSTMRNARLSSEGCGHLPRRRLRGARRVCGLLALALCCGAHVLPAQQSVLFVGDSIACSTSVTYTGYSWFFESQGEGWRVGRILVTTSADLLSQVEGSPSAFHGYDVIYFNTGLHSLRSDRIESLATYETNLVAVSRQLKAIEGTKLVWRTTTPIADGASWGRDHTLVPVYNEASVRVMNAACVAIDDVYGYLLPYYRADSSKGGLYLAGDGTHWNTWSQENLIAPHVAGTVSIAVGASALPSVSVALSPAGSPAIEFLGTLQRSIDLVVWEDCKPQPVSPWMAPTTNGAVFYRSVCE